MTKRKTTKKSKRFSSKPKHTVKPKEIKIKTANNAG